VATGSIEILAVMYAVPITVDAEQPVHFKNMNVL
jgi:hypothetical protein